MYYLLQVSTAQESNVTVEVTTGILSTVITDAFSVDSVLQLTKAKAATIVKIVFFILVFLFIGLIVILINIQTIFLICNFIFKKWSWRDSNPRPNKKHNKTHSQA